MIKKHESIVHEFIKIVLDLIFSLTDDNYHLNQWARVLIKKHNNTLTFLID